MPTNNLFTGATGVTLEESNIQIGDTIIHQTPETRTPAKGLDLLFERSAHNALVDSKARYDAPKCDERTRKAIIQRIMDWIGSDEEWASALWLHGSAGSGKSALARTIAELCAAKKSLLATFFFTRTRTIRITDGDYLIPTLALQLTRKMRVPRRYIKKCLLQHPDIFHRPREVQMQELIVNPLSTYFSRLEYHCRRLIQKAPLRLIVIDGLDECFGKDVQCDLLQVLGKAVERLRLPLRFLIASRPEPHIRDSFDDDDGVFRANRFTTLNLNEDPNIARDIRTYLEVQFTKIRNTHKIRSEIPASWPLAKDIATLIERASGQFIFVSTMVGYVSSPKHNPVTRLTIITNRLQPPAADAPYGQLDLLYQLIFSSAEEEGTDINKILQVLATLIAQPGDALGYPYNTYSGIGDVLNMTPGDVFLLLDEFASLIEVPPLESMLPIKILHASLVDFLLDSSRSGQFNIDMRWIHRVLALYYSEYIPSHITTITPSTHRDNLKHHFLPFITHWKNADIPVNDGHLCDTLSLISEAMIFLCQCTEPCEGSLQMACRELLADDVSLDNTLYHDNIVGHQLPTSSPASHWKEQIIKQRPVIVMITLRGTWTMFHALRSNIPKRPRNIGSSGPEGSLLRAADFGAIPKIFGESEVVVIDIHLSVGDSEAVLKWLKRLENMRINFSGVLVFQDVLSDKDWIRPDGLYRQIFQHCETLCPMALVLMEESRQAGKAPHGDLDNCLRAWEQAGQVGGTLLWSRYRETEQSAHQILWDVLLENTTWKQQQKDRHKNTSSNVLKEIGTSKGPISEEAWQRAIRIARETYIVGTIASTSSHV